MMEYLVVGHKALHFNKKATPTQQVDPKMEAVIFGVSICDFFFLPTSF